MGFKYNRFKEYSSIKGCWRLCFFHVPEVRTCRMLSGKPEAGNLLVTRRNGKAQRALASDALWSLFGWIPMIIIIIIIMIMIMIIIRHLISRVPQKES